MTQYRFITRNRRGKWYDDLANAQANAEAIGAGFSDPFGTFQPYRGTILELREKDDHREWQKLREDAD